MSFFTITRGLVVSADTESVGPALSGIARVDALVTDLFVDVIAGVVGLTLGVVFACVRLDTNPSETNGTRRAIECGRARSANSTDLVVNASLSGWLTGIQRVTDQSGGTDTLEAADDIDAVGTSSTRVALKTFVNVLTPEEGIAVETGRTNAFDAGGPFQTCGALTACYVIASRNRCARLVRVSAVA